jgi:serine/threonine-protein kinase RsbW
MHADLVADVKLAVSEAATNAVRHSGCSSFEIHGHIDGASLIVSIVDRGQGVDAANPGLGLGMEIIRGLTESLEIDHVAPGTRITMRFGRHPHA